jgi:hypothetical protein
MVVEINYGLYRSASIDVKAGYPDPADFATTAHMPQWGK